MMSQATDFWYVRLPDGRILRAASTKVVRQEVGAGRIPLDSTVRRSPAEEWVSLEWTREFADLSDGYKQSHTTGPQAAPHADAVGTPSTVASRQDPRRMRQIGVGTLLTELLAALDSTLTRPKLLTAVLAGLALGILATVVETQVIDLGNNKLNVTAVVAALVLVVSLAMGVLTRLTYVELSRLRPARWKEALEGLGPLTVRLAVALGLVTGGLWGLWWVFRSAPFWILPEAEGGWSWAATAAAGAALAAGMALEVVLWAILGVSGLLAPLLVVEQVPVATALSRWLGMIRQHLGRLFLFEAMALVIGLAVALPCAALLLPLLGVGNDSHVLLPGLYVEPRLALAYTVARNLLAGLAGALLLAYVVVANVFIYLHLRYAIGAR
jgi:hypothetical protein